MKNIEIDDDVQVELDDPGDQELPDGTRRFHEEYTTANELSYLSHLGQHSDQGLGMHRPRRWWLRRYVEVVEARPTETWGHVDFGTCLKVARAQLAELKEETR